MEWYKGSMKTLLLCLAVLFASSMASATAPKTCAFSVIKTLMPLKTANPVCLDEYFYERNLAQYSISAEAYAFYRDTMYMQFDDWLLFTVPSQEPMGEVGRLQLVRQMYETYLKSLRDTFGDCKLNLYGGDKLLTIDDFKVVQRDEEGQPGTRIVLNNEILKNQRWELVCKGATGEYGVEKSGGYFYIFFDVYENQGDQGLVGHFSKFLLSFRP